MAQSALASHAPHTHLALPTTVPLRPSTTDTVASSMPGWYVKENESLNTRLLVPPRVPDHQKKASTKHITVTGC